MLRGSMGTSYWEKVYSSFEPFYVKEETFIGELDKSQQMFFELIGEVQGKNVLEIGCGNGASSVYLAQKGAKVTAIDNSSTAIDNVKALAKYNSVEHLIGAFCLDALELDKLNRSYDLIIGSYVLHHIEPFDLFTDILFNLLHKGGRGIFLENNSRNIFLLFFRKYVAGRFGVPKYGDDKEYPFEPREIEMLRLKFGNTQVYYAEFLFFRLLNKYLFNNKAKLDKVLGKLDGFVYNHFKALHKYSYRQIIEFKKE